MKNDVVSILEKIGAVIRNDHFIYTSGRHGSLYINKDALYPHTKETSKVGKMFAEKFKNKKIDVVIAPAIGGTILSQWTAYHLSKLTRKEVLSAYSEKDKGQSSSGSESGQIIKRGYERLIPDKNILIIEDLTTTGISVKKTADAVKNLGGHVIAVCVMVNRDPEKVNSKTIGAPFFSLGVLSAEAVQAKECNLCKKNIPINIKIGHGKKFLEEAQKI